MTTISDEILEEDVRATKHQLPMFLNVLTILTFIGSGFAVIGAIYNLATIEQQKEAIRLLESMGSMRDNPFMNDSMIESMKVAYENIYLMQGSALVVAIACIVGAYLMRKLKKSGFFIYLGASIVSVAIPLAVIGFGLMGMMIVAGSIFTIAFIIMYGVNYKYLH